MSPTPVGLMNNRRLKHLFIFLAVIAVQGLVWLLPYSAVTRADRYSWDVQHFLLRNMTTNSSGKVETFAEMQQSAWCQPSSIRNGNYLGLNIGKNPCSSFDAQYYEAQRRAEVDAGIQRIYYINLDKNIKRRQRMERKLNNQTALGWNDPPIPFKRIPALVGDEPPSVCAPDLRDPHRCRGVQGILKSNLHIIQYENVKGISLIMEDDFRLLNLSMVHEALQWIPDDWDIIRIECIDYDRRISFDYIDHPEYMIFRAQFVRPCNGTLEKCSYCGGAFAMLWRESSLSKLYRVWADTPAQDLDCRLAWDFSIRSYCFNTHYKVGAHRPPHGERTDIPKNPAP